MLLQVGKHALQLIQPEISIGSRGSAHTNESDLRLLERPPRIPRRGEAASGDGVPDNVLQPGLVEGRFSGCDLIDFELVFVDSEYAVTQLSEAGGGDAADVTQAEDRYGFTASNGSHV